MCRQKSVELIPGPNGLDVWVFAASSRLSGEQSYEGDRVIMHWVRETDIRTAN